MSRALAHGPAGAEADRDMAHSHKKGHHHDTPTCRAAAAGRSALAWSTHGPVPEARIHPDAEAFADMFRIVSAYGVAVPPEIAAVFRTLATLQGTLTHLAADFDMVSESQHFADTEVTAQLAPVNLKDAGKKELLELVPLLRRLPRRFDRITAAIERGQLSTHVRAPCRLPGPGSLLWLPSQDRDQRVGRDKPQRRHEGCQEPSEDTRVDNPPARPSANQSCRRAAGTSPRKVIPRRSRAGSWSDRRRYRSAEGLASAGSPALPRPCCCRRSRRPHPGPSRPRTAGAAGAGQGCR
jgi:hypothetical protein